MDDENLFTLGFILDETGQYVLLTRPTKENHPFKGRLNGIGGKVRIDERPIDAMAREIWEEAEILLTENDRYQHMVCMRFPNGVEMFVYYIILHNANVFFEDKVTNEGILRWYNINDRELLTACNPNLGGNGDVAYFLNLSRVLYVSQFV